MEDLKLLCRIVSSKRLGIPIDTMASHVSTKIHNTPNVQFNNNKFKSSHPAKRAKYATSVAKTPNRNWGICYNCNSTDHYANKCPRPLSCRYCKNPGHFTSSCPIRLNRKKAKLNAFPTSSNPSS